MNGTIKVLDASVIGRIAAGESVSRPAAIVKELVENSLDAGASRVEVIIADGGRTLIQVTDDGHGMGAEDLRLCVVRHATSKITTFDDLCRALTYGFRGEALASISAVASVDILSGRDKVGHHLRWSPTEPLIAPAPYHQGTRIRVRDLFKEIPARLKFLRSDRAETLGVLAVMKAAALSCPDVAFFLREQSPSAVRDLLSAPAEPQAHRVRRVMGEGFVSTAFDVTADAGDVCLHGKLASARGFRAVMGDYHLFLNGRPIRSAEVTGAVRSAFGAALPSDKHAPYVLFLTLPPQDVDVNIHPTKAEVRFRDPERVASLVRDAVQSALDAARPDPRPRPVIQAAGPTQPELDAPVLTIGDWQVFAENGEIYGFSRKEAVGRILGAADKVDLAAPIILAFPVPLPARDRARALGFEIADFGGGTVAISTVPAGVEADPRTLAAGLRPGFGDADLLDWAAGGVPDTVMMSAGRTAAVRVPIAAFEKMMRRV